MSLDVTVTSVTPCQDCLTVNISKVACPGGCLVNQVIPCQDCLTLNISKVACPGGCLMNQEDPDHFISKLSHTEDYIIGIYLIILGKIILYDFLILIFFFKYRSPII